MDGGSELQLKAYYDESKRDDVMLFAATGDVVDIASYVKYSQRLREALTPHVASLLASGLDVVLDFPGNTRLQRAWFRERHRVPSTRG